MTNKERLIVDTFKKILDELSVHGYGDMFILLGSDAPLFFYTSGYSTAYAKTLTEQDAKNLLKRYDLDKYEELFGKLEEA